MIERIEQLPGNMVGFRASEEVTKEDFEEVVLPAVKGLIEERGDLNYLLELDTSIKNFTLGAWWKDALMGLQVFTHWNRAAIVTDSSSIQTFTDLFSKVMPGEFRGFDKADMNQAVEWVSGKDKQLKQIGVERGIEF